LGGLELVADKSSKRSFPAQAKAAALATTKALQQGLIVRPLPGDTVGICPPLIITEDEIDTLFDRLRRALDAVQAELPAAA
jgi:4-aminobutyrate--pyruvate transaminase